MPVDEAKAAEVSKMRVVESTQHVTLAELKRMLKQQRWRDEWIKSLFRDDYVPDRVQVGNVMLVVKK